MRYVAFLRGINVGGRNMIKMSYLKAMFEDLGFKDVFTYLQSGNVLFETGRARDLDLVEKIEHVLPGTRVAVRPASDLASLLAQKPFTANHSELKRRFVTFLREPASGDLKLKPSVEIVLRTKQDIAWYMDPAEGRFEYPSFEAQLKVDATTRGWGVVERISAMLSHG
jgi:uncharacterized protein (DUF1697 family)